jgi:hypothetical protein
MRADIFRGLAKAQQFGFWHPLKTSPKGFTIQFDLSYAGHNE